MNLSNLISSKTVAALVIAATQFTAAIPAAFATPTAAEYGVVLNLSGKQRMLTQKMSKEALFIALGINAEKNVQSLAATVSLFDKTLVGLRDGDASLGLPATQSGRIVRQLDKVAELWTGYQTTMNEIISSKSVSEAHVDVIATQSVPLLKAMNKAVGLYEKDAQMAGLETDPSLATTINLSGKQRMLSQKMTKEMLLHIYQSGTGDARMALLETTSLFERTLAGLLDGDDNLDLPGTAQPDIRDQLQVVSGIWGEFKGIIEEGVGNASGLSSDKLQVLETDNLTLLKEMNKAVGMYADLAA